MKPASLVAAVVLDIVAFAHLLRLIFHTPVMIGDTAVPMWVSVVGFILATGLSILVFREARSQTS